MSWVDPAAAYARRVSRARSTVLGQTNCWVSVPGVDPGMNVGFEFDAEPRRTKYPYEVLG